MSNRFWLYRGMLFIAVIFPFARAVTSFKSAIPTINPFFADPYFADLDVMIFGTDPWRITHSMFGPLATLIIDRVYFLWFAIMMLMIGWLCFTRNRKLQLRGLLTYLFSWSLLGSLFATLTASVGPCFYKAFYSNDRFDGLMLALYQDNQSHTLFAPGAMQFLLKSIGKDQIGAGISAMPSMHVSIAFLCFLVTLDSTRQIWLKLLAFAFAMTIMVGSVHLGWHYAVDGLAGIAGVTLIWIGAGRFVNWVEARQIAASGGIKQEGMTAF